MSTHLAALNLRTLASMAFAIAVSKAHPETLPDAEHVEVKDDKGDEVPEDAEQAIVACKLVIGDSEYIGTVWCANVERREALARVTRVKNRQGTYFLGVSAQPRNVSEDYIEMRNRCL